MDARAIAWRALRAVEDGTADRLDDALEAGDAHGGDAGLARELAFGVARNHRLYDHLAGAFLRPGAQPPDLTRALRLGAHQLFALDRVPPHAAVHATVETLKREGSPKLAGVANAVLRRLADLRLAERIGDGPEGRLPEAVLPADPAVRHSLPALLVEDLLASDPPGGIAALAALNRVPPLCTRSRPGRPRPNGAGILRQDGAWTWWSDPRAALAGPVARGEAVVQDRAQGEVVELSGARPGELVLDLCAAPGGKALAFADRGCRVIAADISVPKIRAMARGAIADDAAGEADAQLVAAERSGGIGRDHDGSHGATGVRLVVADGSRAPLAASSFDVVLVDAPCSNSGVLARRPEARWRYIDERLIALGEVQRGLLASAARLVAPGGKLVYATCSLAPRENQAVAHDLAGWRLLGERRTWPDAWHAGGYAAVLVRR